MNVSPKVTAGVSGSGVAGAITVVAVWIASAKFHVEIPPEIGSAITTIVSPIVGAISAWLVRATP